MTAGRHARRRPGTSRWSNSGAGHGAPFADRREAGRALATRLAGEVDDDVVVVGLPRGGVPVASVVAKALGVPLDIIVVRKLGLPGRPELAMGAIGEDGTRVIDREIIEAVGVGEDELAAVEARERVELERRARLYREGVAREDLRGRTVIIVDDGIATGSTARAACAVVRELGARRVVLAVPVAPPDWAIRLGSAADDLVAVITPEPFFGVGQFYDDFGQTTDREVIDLLEAAAARVATRDDGQDRSA